MFSVSLADAEDTAYGGDGIFDGRTVSSVVLEKWKGLTLADCRSPAIDAFNEERLLACRSTLAISGTTLVRFDRRRRNSASIGLSPELVISVRCIALRKYLYVGLTL